MAKIKEKMNSLIGDSCILEVQKIDWSVVKQACSMMKPGKNDVTEAFSSDALLHGPDLLFVMLADIFRSFLIH